MQRYKVKFLVIHSNTEHNDVQVLYQTNFMMLDTVHVVVVVVVVVVVDYCITTAFSEIWKNSIPILAALDVFESWKAHV